VVRGVTLMSRLSHGKLFAVAGRALTDDNGKPWATDSALL